MRKGVLLARSNLQKSKGQTAAILILMLLAVSMLQLWLMLSMDYRQNFERCHDRLNAEHVTLAADGGGEIRDFLTELAEKDKRTAEYALDMSMHMVGSFDFNGGEVNTELVILDKQTAVSRKTGRIEMVEDSTCTSGIYMPVLYKSDEIAVGKTIQITIGSRQMSYTVCGFFNSIMAGSHNCSMCEIVLTEDQYDELKKTGYAPESVLLSLRIQDRTESEAVEAAFKNAVASHFPGTRMVSNSYALVSQSRYISQMVCSGIVSAMAFFVLLIALVVMASNIINYIQENMRKLGVLKAIGYTSRQLAGALLLQFEGLIPAAVTGGTGIAYGVFPYINEMMISQTGIPYQIHFLPVPFFLTLVTLAGTTALAVWFAARRIRKVEPITALRQGIQTHSFKVNHVPLDRTRAPLHLALALKTTLSSVKHNITICITMLVLSLVVVFSGLMVENVIMDITPFVHLIVGETADSCINVNKKTEDEFLRKMKADRRVEKVYLYHTEEVRHAGGPALSATLTEDFAEVNNRDIIFEGRFPRYANEIAVAGKYASEKHLKTGDEIRITSGGKEAAYIISGFTQTSNNLGKDCLLTREGYERLCGLQNTSYYLNLASGTDIDAFNSEVREQFGEEANAAINIDATINGTASVYVSLMSMIVAGVLVLSAVVVAFVLYLLVRTTLAGKRKDYGILKAVGFTTGQLIMQTALSFMPAAVISTVAGITLCCLIINPLTALFLNSIGIVKSTFTMPVGFAVIAGAGLILYTFGAACLMSFRIRKMNPRELLVS